MLIPRYRIFHSYKSITCAGLFLFLLLYLVLCRSAFLVCAFLGCLQYTFINFAFGCRPPPPIPEMHLSEEMIDKASEFVSFHVNILLSAFNDVAQGKNSKLYYTIALCLVLISTFGRLTDILSFSYASKYFSWYYFLETCFLFFLFYFWLFFFKRFSW